MGLFFAFLDVGSLSGGNSQGGRKTTPVKSETPTKRVSFMPEEGEGKKYDANANLDQEKIDRLNAKEDPNVSLQEKKPVCRQWI